MFFFPHIFLKILNCHWESLSWMHYRRLADGQPSFSRLATGQARGHWSQCLIMAISICGTLTHESAPCGDTQAQILPCFVPIKGALVGTEVLAESFSWCVLLIGVMVKQRKYRLYMDCCHADCGLSHALDLKRSGKTEKRDKHNTLNYPSQKSHMNFTWE